jgi:predicted HD phosphohydrolase
LPTDCAADLDDHHEVIGHAFLRQHFGQAVAEPVRLHVAAKRYLCTRYPEYQQNLSPTSLQSFLDQGGVMTDAECRAFEQEPFLDAAVRLREWDDRGKDPLAEPPAIQEFVSRLESAVMDGPL